MAWVITENLEPVYIDDKDDGNMCPVPCEDCGCRDSCYWVHDDTNELEFLNDAFNVKF